MASTTAYPKERSFLKEAVGNPKGGSRKRFTPLCCPHSLKGLLGFITLSDRLEVSAGVLELACSGEVLPASVVAGWLGGCAANTKMPEF